MVVIVLVPDRTDGVINQFREWVGQCFLARRLMQ